MEEPAEIGDVNESQAICVKTSGPVELWNTSSGSYVVYLHLDDDLFLYKKRGYPEEAEQLFEAVAKMVRKR